MIKSYENPFAFLDQMKWMAEQTNLEKEDDDDEEGGE